MPYWLLHLHEQYESDVIRIGPDELSFISPTAWNDICGRGPGFPKNPALTPGISAIISANDSDHRRYRQTLSAAFSDKALKEQESIIRIHVDKLMDCFRARAGIENIDLLQWFNWAIFDVVGDLAFGESFDCLQGSAHRAWVANIALATKGVSKLSVFSRFPPLDRVMQLLLWNTIRGTRNEHDRLSAEKVNRRLAVDKDRPDFLGYISRNNSKGGMTRDEIIRNSASLISAGVETTAALLTGTLFLLIQNPLELQKVQKEIRDSFIDAEDIQLQHMYRLRYLNAVIEEASRMYPPAINGQTRKTPVEGGTVSGFALPGGIAVQINQYAANRSTRNFVSPATFAPSRWLGDSQFETDKKDACQPFSVGPRNCIGKNLALFEMRLIIARLFWNFEMEPVEETDRGWLNQLGWMAWQRKPLIVRLIARKQ